MVTYILATTARKMERARINATQQAVGKVARSVRKLAPTTGFPTDIARGSAVQQSWATTT